MIIQKSRTQKFVLKALNATFLTLIPKGDTADSQDKIISKVLVNRLKIILPLLISQHQTGYVEGRQIMDNIILSHELIHSLKMQKKPSMMIHLDMSKAFDKINWVYMREVLAAYGFDKECIKWIMAMVMGLFFINPPEWLTLSALPPLKRHIMSKGLSLSIIVALSSNDLSNLKLYALAPPSMCQQFVDDTLLIGLPTAKEATPFKAILSYFFDAYGTSINQEKSKLFFNTSPSIQRNIVIILNFPISILPSKYLGVPLTNKPMVSSIWKALLSKLEKRLPNWTFISLNMASHLVLVKSVLQAIPHYLYSALVAPKAISNTIRNLQRNFLLRGVEKKNKKWALVAWEKYV